MKIFKEKIYNVIQVSIMVVCGFLMGFCVHDVYKNALSSFEAVAASPGNLNPNAEVVVSSHGFISDIRTNGVTVDLGKYKVTAYCPCEKCCGIWATKGVDEDGDRVTPGNRKILKGDKFVAADPKLLSRGDWIIVPGYNNNDPVEVRDVGGAIKGRRLDVFFDDDPKTGLTGHQRALNWGVQDLEIEEIIQ